MVAHAIELLTAGSEQAEVLLHDEHYNLGGISIVELHRLAYAQVLSSHALTWQVSAIFLSKNILLIQSRSGKLCWTDYILVRIFCLNTLYTTCFRF